jgi:putative tryptophan/tyrosine transport system substrate-binding protein
MKKIKLAQLALLLLLLLLLFSIHGYAQNTVTLGVLLAGDFRSSTVEGFKEGMKKYPHSLKLDVKNAKGERKYLKKLAAEIIQSKPDVAIAAGGVEADALFEASKGTDIPVVFLAVSSAVDRGLVASLKQSKNNLTGIETNDTELTAKRLWFIRKMLPNAKKVTLFKVPSITPSVKSVEIAKRAAPSLGFKLRIIEVINKQAIIKSLSGITAQNTDVILPAILNLKRLYLSMRYKISFIFIFGQ